MYFRRKTSAGRAYLQIVESRRDGDQVRQQVTATLGRYDKLQASGQLERLLQSGARFAPRPWFWPRQRPTKQRRLQRGGWDRRWCSSAFGRKPAAAR
jgi:hypothetical protein